MNNWLLWQDKTHSPYMNMALDEVLMLNAAAWQKPVLRLYEWDRNSVSFGYIQKIDRVPREGVEVVRRPTGGGIVYHQHHFTYTVVFPPDHWLVKDCQPIESYHWVNKAVKAGLEELQMSSELAKDEIAKSVDRAGMVCFTTPTRYDLLAGDTKIAGSAQRRTKDGMLHQGSIELEGMEQLSAETLRRVLPIGFKKVFDIEFDSFETPQAFLEQAKQVAEDKYASKKWNEKR